MILTSDEIETFLAANGQTLTAATLALVSLTQGMIEAAAERFMGTKFSYVASIVEFHPRQAMTGRGDTEALIAGYEKFGPQAIATLRGNPALSALALGRTPVRGINSVYENSGAWMSGAANGSFPNALDPAGYQLDLMSPGYSPTGLLYRTSGVWSSAPRTVKVDYSAGWTQDEIDVNYPDVKLGLLTAMMAWWNSTMMKSFAGEFGGPINSVNIEDFSVSFNANAAVKAYALPAETKQILEPYINYSAFIGR